MTAPTGPGDGEGLAAGRVTKSAVDGWLMAVFGPGPSQLQVPVRAPWAPNGTPAVGSEVWAIRDDRGQRVAVGVPGAGPLETVVPHARLRRLSTLACPSGAVTVIPWEQATYDRGTDEPQWSTLAPTAWVCRRAGLYRFTATVPIAADGDETRRVVGVSRVRDGVGIDVMVQAETGSGGDAATINGATEHRCEAGDTVLVFAYQDSGAVGSIDPALLRFTASFASA